MAYLNDKSDKYIKVAEFLESAKFYHAIPHSSYYSCLQLMKHQIKTCLGIDYDAQEKERKEVRNGSHEYIIRKFRELLTSKGGSLRSIRDFNNEIIQLKVIREEADYENKEININVYTDTITRAKELRKIIKTFKL